MTSSTVKNVGILGLGVCLPETRLTNADLEKMVDTTDEWIMSRTGISERRILAPGEKPLDLALPAAQRAIADAGVDPSEIDAILYCSFTPDHAMPPSSCVLQGKLGLAPCIAYDLNAACSGFIFGLQTAYALIRSGLVRKALVLGVDANSRVIDYRDRNTCVLFGDGAGAVVVGEVPEGRGIIGNSAGSDGRGADLITQKIGAAGTPVTAENLNDPDRFIQMNGREVYKFAVQIINVALEKAAAEAGIAVTELELLVPHQANVRIIRSSMERFGFREDQVVINMDRYGNTSAASISLALDTARQEGRLKKGTLCGLVAFGAGLTYGATILRW